MTTNCFAWTGNYLSVVFSNVSKICSAFTTLLTSQLFWATVTSQLLFSAVTTLIEPGVRSQLLGAVVPMYGPQAAAEGVAASLPGLGRTQCSL